MADQSAVRIMTTEREWVPVRVRKIDIELSHEEQRLPGLERDVAECKERIQTLRRNRQIELSSSGPDAEAAV